jgi:MFS family permease
LTPTVPYISRDPSRKASLWPLIQVAILIGAGAVIGALVGALTTEKLTFLYKDQLHLSVSSVSTIGIIVGIPSYLQSFMGTASDVFPLWGYHRRTYYILGTLIAALGFFGMSLLHDYKYATIVCLVMIAAAGGTLAGVVTNAVMVAVGNRTGTFPRLQALITFLPLMLGILPYWNTNDFGGYVTEHWSYHRAFLTAAVLTLLYLPFVFFMEDSRVSAARHAQETAEEHAARRAARQAERAHIQAALRAAVRTPGLWAIAAYLFYLNVTPLLINASTYYMNDSLHLSKQFIGSVQKWGNWGSLFALLIYALAGKRLTTPMLVWGALITDCGIYLVAMGMHDAPSARLVTGAWALLAVALSLCVNTLAARACPPDIEATVFGVMQAVVALSLTLCDKFGSALYDFFGPANKAHHYTAAHGWFSALWFGFGFTLLAIFFIPFLPAWAKHNLPSGPSAPAVEEIPPGPLS